MIYLEVDLTKPTGVLGYSSYFLLSYPIVVTVQEVSV